MCCFAYLRVPAIVGCGGFGRWLRKSTGYRSQTLHSLSNHGTHDGLGGSRPRPHYLA